MNEQQTFTVLPNRTKNLVQTPTFLTGEFGKAVFADYCAVRKERFNENPFFQLQLQDDSIAHSTLQDALLLDEILREKYGARVLLPSDLHDDMRVPNAIKDKHYVDRAALILRGPTARFYDERAKNIAESLEGRAEIDTVRLQTEPALVTGLKVVPAEGGYGFVFEPSKDGLKVVHSDKFTQAYHEKRFKGFDKDGVPTNFAEDGIFRNYNGDSRVSWFSLHRSWGSDSSWRGFGLSTAVARVVVADAVGASKISDVLAAQQKSELLATLSTARQNIADIEAKLR